MFTMLVMFMVALDVYHKINLHTIFKLKNVTYNRTMNLNMIYFKPN